MRTADPKLKEALKSGAAHPIGWLVPGDEIQIDPSKFPKQAIGEFLDEFKEYGSISSWRVSGFDTPTRVILKPRVLSNEPLKKGARLGGRSAELSVSYGVQKIVGGSGWVVAINALLQSGSVRVIRRNALGEVRTSSESHLPVSANLR